MNTPSREELVERVAREVAVYLTKRRDVLDVIMAGDAGLGRTMMIDLAHRIIAAINSIPIEREEVTEAMREAGKAAWIRCIDAIPSASVEKIDAFGEVYKARRAAEHPTNVPGPGATAGERRAGTRS